MFPFDIDDEELEVTVDSDTVPTDYEIDFETGKLTGRVISGLPAIEQWIKLALGVDRYYFTQYSWDFGSDLNSLIGKSLKQDYVESEVKRMVADALSVSDDIESISDLTCSLTNDKLTASFTVNTVYGGIEINV